MKHLLCPSFSIKSDKGSCKVSCQKPNNQPPKYLYSPVALWKCGCNTLESESAMQISAAPVTPT